MRPKTEVEIASHRGEIRLEICTMRSNIVPRWWEFRRYYRWMKLVRQVENDRKNLDPETQLALAWAEEALEREFVYGRGDD